MSEQAVSRWTRICTREEIEANNALTASIDPSFARLEKAFYESRTARQLRTLSGQAWNCNNIDGYCMARSYLALDANERATDRGEC